MIRFGREVCGFLPASERREWLVTNGLGGYAAGTVAGLRTRRYHGLLIAALQPPAGRTLMLASLEETASSGPEYALYSRRMEDGAIEPGGYRHIESFRLEGTTPVWSFALGEALIEKRIWMEQGVNTTYIRYGLRRGRLAVKLRIRVLVNYRDHHAVTQGEEWQADTLDVTGGVRITTQQDAVPLTLRSDSACFTKRQAWQHGELLSVEQERDSDYLDDHLSVGRFDVELQPGQSYTLVASTEGDTGLDGKAAYQRRSEYERQLIKAASFHPAGGRSASLRAAAKQLILAADQFIVQRSTPDNPNGRTIIAGYPWFGDWGAIR